MLEVFLQNFLSLSKIVVEFQQRGGGEVGNKIVRAMWGQLRGGGNSQLQLAGQVSWVSEAGCICIACHKCTAVATKQAASRRRSSRRNSRRSREGKERDNQVNFAIVFVFGLDCHIGLA